MMITGLSCPLSMRGVPCQHDYRGLGNYKQLTAMWCWLQTGDNRWLITGHGANPLLSGNRKSEVEE